MQVRPEAVQDGGVPIWVAGDNLRAFKRLAEYGQGWYAMGLSPEEIAERLPNLDPKRMAAAGGPWLVAVRCVGRIPQGGHCRTGF